MSQTNLGRRAEVRVRFNNVDITEDINENRISLSYTDESEGAADDLSITIHDRDGKWLKKWLRKELEQRDRANADIAQGIYDGGTGGGSGATYRVTAKSGLNVRKGRGTGYSIIGGLSYGATVTVREIVDGWATITYSGSTAYVCADYLTKSGGTSTGGGTSPSGTAWAIGDKVTVTGRARSNSYGTRARIGYQVTNHAGTITALNLKNGVPYPIHIDDLGWYAEECITGGSGAGGQNDGSTTPSAKYTKINAVIVVRNCDGAGTDQVLDCGKFELDNVRFSTPPAKIEMSATSLTYESAIRKTKKTRSWSKTSLKGIAEDIATSGGYKTMYLSAYNPTYSYILQDGISDIEFLSRRCAAHGLKLKVTDGILVVFDAKKMEETEAVRTFRNGDGSYTSISLESSLSTTAYSSCHVSYENDQGTTYEATFTPATAYSEGEVLEVKEQVGSNAEAMELAKRRLRAENKGEFTGKIKTPGDPRLVAGVNIMLSGFGDFDGKYSVEKSTHKVPPYTTEIEITRVVEGY